MEQNIISRISTELNLQPNQIKNVAKLFEDGATIPFIARYRKEQTDSLDEVQIADVKSKIDFYDTLQKRKITITN